MTMTKAEKLKQSVECVYQALAVIREDPFDDETSELREAYDMITQAREEAKAVEQQERELRQEVSEQITKREMLAILIQTPDGIFTFPDGDYVVTGTGTPVQELQDVLRDLLANLDGLDDAEVVARARRLLAVRPGY